MADRPRMVMKIIRSCKECPHASYYSGGAYTCAAMDFKTFPDTDAPKKVQAWCPLDHAPASIT